MLKDLPLSVGIRVFEQFLCEGEKALYRAELGVFKWSWDLPKIPVRRTKDGIVDEAYFREHANGICSIKCMPQTALF